MTDHRRARGWVLTTAAILLLSSTVAAEESPSAPSQSRTPGRIETSARVLLGLTLGLVAHEAGHLVADIGVGQTPGLKRVSYAGIPFFAITHQPVGAGKEFVISSAGFWAQHVTSEVILSRHPRLRHERAPVLRGVLAFNVLVSVMYASAALARTGPPERDTRGIAASVGMDEPAIAPVVLLPAALDAVRYFRPTSPTAKWVSRAAKVASVALVFKTRR